MNQDALPFVFACVLQVLQGSVLPFLCSGFLPFHSSPIWRTPFWSRPGSQLPFLNGGHRQSIPKFSTLPREFFIDPSTDAIPHESDDVCYCSLSGHVWIAWNDFQISCMIQHVQMFLSAARNRPSQKSIISQQATYVPIKLRRPIISLTSAEGCWRH